jgi:hypothetical protein
MCANNCGRGVIPAIVVEIGWGWGRNRWAMREFAFVFASERY